MRLISHRGNLSGRNFEFENSPELINSSLSLSYDVECDVWYRDGELWLGHDEPQHKINYEFLEQPGIWAHAKNIDALTTMLYNSKVHCFFHQGDDATITSQGYVWTFPGKPLRDLSICVLPESVGLLPSKMYCYGICSDYISTWAAKQND